MLLSSKSRRRFFAPEVVQTSAMDCGPASLKCVLEGFGISAAYGRLREACQTDVDGTSIDQIEELAGRLGLEAEQLILPPEHLLLPEAQSLPAIVVVRLPSGATHFVVVWGRLGSRVQVMDPANGRRWLSAADLLSSVYLHRMAVPASGFRGWAAEIEFQSALGARLAALGVPLGHDRHRRTALADGSFRSLAALDAAVRMVTQLLAAGGIHRGRDATRLLDALLEQAARDDGAIAERFWSARPAPRAEDGTEQVFLRGAVVVRIRQRTAEFRASLSPELAAALTEVPARPLLELLAVVRGQGLLTPAALAAGLSLGAIGTVFEAVLLRALLDVGRALGLLEQRLAAAAALLVLLALLFALEWPLVSGILRLGRKLEIGLTIAYWAKIPRLGDRYFQSRPLSDMAERSHSAHLLRTLPPMVADLLRAALQLVATVAAIAWLDPRSACRALTAAAVLLAVPILANGRLLERDLRVRTHVGALMRFYLDALLGLMPIRTLGAERALRREHEALLVEWARAKRSLFDSWAVMDGLQACLGFGLAAWILFEFAAGGGSPTRGLLLLYWSLALPAIGQELSAVLRSYPELRNVTLRLLEPLGAPDEAPQSERAVTESRSDRKAVALRFEGVQVQAAGHVLFDRLTLAIPAGSHVAIVGASGAGKSTLLGLLLGFHRATAGQVSIDDEPLDATVLARLRAQTTWIDPAVQLHNRTFLENLRYCAPDAPLDMSSVLETAGLREILQRLPDGQQSALGEGGALLSGGEGQRLRFGRGLASGRGGLVLLDEPFRGLDRTTRHQLLLSARERFRAATLLCVTHDIEETLGFQRVIVIEQGRVIEDDTPSTLARSGSSRYRALLDAELQSRKAWSHEAWRRLRLEHGQVRLSTTSSAE